MTNLNTIFLEKSRITNCVNKKKENLKEYLENNAQTIDNFEKPVSIHEGKKYVVVVGGGMSAEREVSLMSADGIVDSLVELGHHVIFVDMGIDIAQVINSINPDVVFNALHGTYGEDGCLQGLLNIMRVPYTGCGVLSSSLAFNKKKSYEIFLANNINIAQTKIVKKSDNLKTDPISRPYVIKPIAQGSSVGVEIIFESDDFSFANYDFPHGDEIIIEQYVKGRELQVAVLNGEALGVLEIELLKNKRFYDYETKYTEGFANHLLPAPIKADAYKKALEISEKIFKMFGCRGMARVEFIYDDQNDIFYTLEINTHPGMTPMSICPEIAAMKNISYTNIVEQILNDAKFE